MPRLWIAAIVAALAVLAAGPARAGATITSSQITAPANGAYLMSLDNPPNPTRVTVTGTAPGAASTDRVDIVCYFGAGSSFGDKVLVASVPVTNTTFTTSPQLRPIAGHSCRLRAIPSGAETAGDLSQYAGPRIAVSEAALPSAAISGKPYDFYINGTTFNGFAAWGSAGSCGPYAAPLDASFGMGNFAINCMGSLLGANLPTPLTSPTPPTRSEVQVDGQNAYDAASAQALIGAGEDLQDFPSLTAAVNWDPTSGVVSSQSDEGLVVCPGLLTYPPTSRNCRKFASPEVHLQRNVTMSDGGQVVTMTDTWSSTDNAAHTLDLLYDDYVGLKTSGAQRGYQLPGQNGFSAYGQGATVPGPSTTPGSVLVRTNVAAPDGDLAEGVGAITFSTAPSEFRFASNNELEEHQILQVPAGGSTSLTYIYSAGYSVADVEALALAAQDRLRGPAIAITSPANGTTVSTPTVNLAGTATAGSGIASLVAGGEPVSVGPGGAWSAQVPLSPGANTITAIATDGAGASVQTQVTVVYQPPPATPPTSPAPAPTCRVPRTKGLKLPSAERALRRAHCKVGRIQRQGSRTVRRGRVTSTSPSAGRQLPAGSKVELFVSRGP